MCYEILFRMSFPGFTGLMDKVSEAMAEVRSSITEIRDCVRNLSDQGDLNKCSVM